MTLSVSDAIVVPPAPAFRRLVPRRRRQLKGRGWLVTVMLATSVESSAQATTRQPNISLAAARVELLALRTAIPRRMPVRRDSLFLETSPTFVSADSATHWLAGLPKPATCQGKPEREALRITCKALLDLDPYAIGIELVGMYSGTYGSVSGDFLFNHVRTNHPSGIDARHVLCTGRDTLVVSVLGMEAWGHDYLQPLDFYALTYDMGGGGDLDSARDTVTLGLRRRYDVVSLFEFSASRDHQDTTGMNQSASGGTGPVLDHDAQMARLARQLRSLTLGADEERLRPALAKIAAMFATYWAGRGSMPPAAIEFVNRYGRDP